MLIIDIIWVCMPKIESLGAFFKFDFQWPLVTSGDLLWLLKSKCHSMCRSRICHEYIWQTFACQKLSPWVHFSNLISSDLWWPLVTSYDYLGQNAIACVGQGYDMSIYAKHWVPGCIFQIWPPIDLWWPPVTSGDLWGQNRIAYVSLGYHMCMY